MADAYDAHHAEQCDGRVLVCYGDSETIEKANQSLSDASRRAQSMNPGATPASPITEQVTLLDREAQSVHRIHIHRVDYRTEPKAPVDKLVAFSRPAYAACNTQRLRLATPNYYRQEEGLKPGIHDAHEGMLTKDARKWAERLIGKRGAVNNASVSFAASSEPWIYCASHYRLEQELKGLKTHFADEYGYMAATGIADPDAFAACLGIDFALSLNKKVDVKLRAIDRIAYAQSGYRTTLWESAGQIDTVVHIYHGPVAYEDCCGQLGTEAVWLDPFGGPRAWFTKKRAFESQQEYRFAVSTLGSPVSATHHIPVSAGLRQLTFDLCSRKDRQSVHGT